MKRNAAARLAAVLVLVAAGIAVSARSAPLDVVTRTAQAGSETIRTPSAIVDATGPESASVAVSRDVKESRNAPARPFSAALAAMGALVALAAARSTRTTTPARRDVRAQFDARRRGPPLLRPC